MSDRLELSDGLLPEACEALGLAAEIMSQRGTAVPPLALPSLTGIGPRILEYLTALVIVRQTLAEAATASEAALFELRSDSSDLDARMAGQLSNEFKTAARGAR